ncbi:MAG: ATP-binding protein [Chitinophagaceae bacterium]
MNKLLTILLLFCCTVARAQFKKPFFHTLDVKSGLPEARVVTMLEDNNGYLWMGTQNGLVRWDGYKFNSYPMYTSDNKVGTFHVKKFMQDSNGKIWAYTSEQGIFYYHPPTDKFIQLPLAQKYKDLLINCEYGGIIDDGIHHTQWILTANRSNSTMCIIKFNTLNNSLVDYSARDTGKQRIVMGPFPIIKDARGKIWRAGDNVLSYFEESTQRFKAWYTLPPNLNGSIIAMIEADPADPDIIWINTYGDTSVTHIQKELVGKTILRFNTKTKAVQHFSPDDKNPASLPANCIFMFTDSLKRNWFTTIKGVSLYNAAQNSFTNYAVPTPEDCLCQVTVCADPAGNLWVGSNAGLFYLNVKTSKYEKIEMNTYEGSLPAHQTGYDNLYYDKSGTFWVGMPWAGIAYMDKVKTEFTTLPLSPVSSSNFIKDKTNQLYIKGHQGDSICFVADTANLYAWHSRTNQYHRIDLKNAAAYKFINNVVTGKDGIIWIGTTYYGLFNYDPKTKAVKHWENDPKDSLSIISATITKMAVGKDGTIWLGTWGNGLISFNPATNRFTNYPFIINDYTNRVPKDSLDDDQVASLMIDGEGIIWIGTNSGALNSYNPATKKFRSYLTKDPDFQCITAIIEDSKKRIWAGSYLSGLYLMDKQKGFVKRYTEADGLLHNDIEALTEDAAGNIWCSTLRGYSRFNPANNSFVNFPMASGISGTDDLDYVYVDSSGTMHQSYTDGMVSFNPAELKPNTIPPSVIIEAIHYKVANTNKDTVLYTQANQEITLHYNENKIEFQFVALHHANSSQNKYAYQLVGYDKDWIQGGTERTATYTNLSAGTYTFKVKAANSDGVWNETGASISITILPPWWKTWWAYCLYVLLIGGSIWWYVRRHSKALRKENLILENKIEQRTAALRKQKEIAETERTRAEQSEKFKQQFLANMSHEIRTPMNVVMGMTRLLIEKNPRNDQFKYLDGINKSSDNLLHIINDILDLSKIEAGKMELEKIDFSLRDMAEQVKQTLNFKAAEKGLELFIDIDSKISEVLIGDPTRLNQILMNLTGNAIKFTEKGSVHIKIEKSVVENNLLFSVIDTGIGIPPDKLQSVFENFSQANTSDTRKYGGTGLGLSISKQLVELMGGNISIKSVEGAGTIFSFEINLPAGSKERMENQKLSQQIDGSTLNGLKILVVDDNEYNRIVVNDTLKLMAEVEIFQAINGKEAIAAVEQNNFDVILMDIQMPVMNGYETTKYIREKMSAPKNSTQVIALTASVIRSDLDKCRAAGMNDYVPKPFTIAQLISALAKAAGREMKYMAKNENQIKPDTDNQSSLTDLSYLEKFCQGNKKQMQKYIGMFTSTVPGLVEKITAALSRNDFTEIANQVHGYKTKWIMMGMNVTKELAFLVERQCREETPGSSVKENILKLLEQIKRATNELL